MTTYHFASASSVAFTNDGEAIFSYQERNCDVLIPSSKASSLLKAINTAKSEFPNWSKQSAHYTAVQDCTVDGEETILVQDGDQIREVKRMTTFGKLGRATAEYKMCLADLQISQRVVNDNFYYHFWLADLIDDSGRAIILRGRDFDRVASYLGKLPQLLAWHSCGPEGAAAIANELAVW